MQAHELERRIAAYPWWYYKFEFDNGLSTPVPDPGMVNRQSQRRTYFFDALLSLTGGSLRGRRVLDLGANAGFWSLQALDAGADFVLGVEARQEHVDQANLVFEAKGADAARYRFDTGDVFSHPLDERFDVVLCLGLLDHVARPVELFERMAGVGAELIVIDTEVSRSRMSVFEVDRLSETERALDERLVLIPSPSAVGELAERFGYDTAMLAQNMTDYTGMSDYRRLRRMAFICSNGRSLDGLAAPARAVAPWWITALRANRAAARRAR